MKRKLESGDPLVEPKLKKRKIDDEIIIEHKAIPELDLPDIISPTKTVNQIFQGIIYYQDFFKIVPRPDKVKCLMCETTIKVPEEWKDKRYDAKLVKHALCKFCKFGLELSKRCKVLEDEYFKKILY